MGRLLLLALALVLTGCQASRSIDRAAFDELYAQTALAEGSVSFVPLHTHASDRPERVVSWFYAGTGKRGHRLVYRELVLASSKRRELRYTLDPEELAIANPFTQTRDRSRWVYVHEAAPGLIPPPRDLLTRRHIPSAQSKPDLAQPQTVEPERVEPKAVE